MKYNNIEEQRINNILTANKREDLYNILIEEDFFIIDNSINWHIINYEKKTIKKKDYIKFDRDEHVYSCNGNFYITHKKKLLKVFNKLIELLNNSLSSEIIEHLNKHYFNNIKSCDYYNFLNWFIMMYIYYINSFSSVSRNEYKFYFIGIPITYKLFRKWALEYKNIYCDSLEKVKNILIVLNNINLDEETESNIKIFSNVCIMHLLGCNSNLKLN